MRGLYRKIYKALKEPGYAFNVLIKRLVSAFNYNFGRGSSNWPETVSLFLTYRCNLACSMCGYWGKCGSLKNKSDEALNKILSIEDLKKLVDELAQFKPNITLFGGEPFLYPGWPELVSYIKTKKMRVNVVTNGTLLFGREEEVIKSGLDEIIFSLEGPQEIHDKITNVPGAFARAYGALANIGRLKREYNSKSPIINIAVTISEDNFSSLFDTYKVACKLEPDSVTFHHLSFVDKQSVEKTNDLLSKNFGAVTQDWTGFLRTELPKVDTSVLIQEIARIKANRLGPEAFFYPDFRAKEIRQYYSNFNFKSKDYKNCCLSPWMTVYIFPDGRVGSCEELNIYFGNIRQSSFKDIWNNKDFRAFRTILKKERAFPVCNRCTELYRD